MIEEVVGYKVAANGGSGDVDVITNIDSVTVFVGPAPGTIITQGDFAFVDRDDAVTINVLENDYLEGCALGDGLAVTTLTDVQLDSDGDGKWDTSFTDESLAFFQLRERRHAFVRFDTDGAYRRHDDVGSERRLLRRDG